MSSIGIEDSNNSTRENAARLVILNALREWRRLATNNEACLFTKILSSICQLNTYLKNRKLPSEITTPLYHYERYWHCSSSARLPDYGQVGMTTAKTRTNTGARDCCHGLWRLSLPFTITRARARLLPLKRKCRVTYIGLFVMNYDDVSTTTTEWKYRRREVGVVGRPLWSVVVNRNHIGNDEDLRIGKVEDLNSGNHLSSYPHQDRTPLKTLSVNASHASHAS